NLRTAPVNTQRFVIIDVRFNNSCFDHYLTHSDIKLSDYTAQLIETVLGLVGDDTVGAVVDGDRAAIVSTAVGTGHRLEQLGHIRGFGVVNLNQLTTQRCQFSNLLLRLKFLTLTGSDFIRWSNQQNVADFALVQTFGFQHQI